MKNFTANRTWLSSLLPILFLIVVLVVFNKVSIKDVFAQTTPTIFFYCGGSANCVPSVSPTIAETNPTPTNAPNANANPTPTAAPVAGANPGSTGAPCQPNAVNNANPTHSINHRRHHNGGGNSGGDAIQGLIQQLLQLLQQLLALIQQILGGQAGGGANTGASTLNASSLGATPIVP